MNIIQILDVTLRDGGNRINFDFSDEDLEHILTPLDESGVEYIEIGYRNGAIHPSPDLGRAGLCDHQYLHYCHSFIKNAKIAVMAHPQNITAVDLNELMACGVSLLRICVSRGQLAIAIPVVELAKKLGFKVSVNFIHASQYNTLALADVVEEVRQVDPDIIYLADSNGSMFPEVVHEIFSRLVQKHPIPLGFHAHDNLGLAQANTIAAINAGVRYIDCSLSGMGKGGGNLRTEFFIAYTQALNVRKYSLETVLPAANYIRKRFKNENETLEMDEFERGISDLSTAEVKIKYK